MFKEGLYLLMTNQSVQLNFFCILPQIQNEYKIRKPFKFLTHHTWRNVYCDRHDIRCTVVIWGVVLCLSNILEILTSGFSPDKASDSLKLAGNSLTKQIVTHLYIMSETQAHAYFCNWSGQPVPDNLHRYQKRGTSVFMNQDAISMSDGLR